MPSNYRSRSSKKPVERKSSKEATSAAPPQTISERTAGYEREQRHPSGPAWKRKVANVVLAHGGICHLCGHPGALQGDHLIQYAEGGSDDLSNLRPAHGSAGKQKNPCPVCGLNCNNVRGGLSLEAGRAKIARRLEKLGVTSEVTEPYDW